MKSHQTRFALLVILFLGLSMSTLLCQSKSGIIVEKNVPIPMVDGTILRADIYRPSEPGTYPVIVGRVGYKLRDWPGDIYTITGEYYSRSGYVVVWQNVRGTFGSEGNFSPFKDDAWGENQDGFATIEWASQQEWSNGKVGTLGVSYSGLTQYLLAPTRPPHLETMFVQMGWGSARNCMFYNGIFELYNTEWWPLGMTLLQIQDDTRTPGIEDSRFLLQKTLGDIYSWHRHLPLNINPSLEGLADWYFDWLKHPEDGPYWWSTDLATMYNEVDVPILHWNGWFDYRVDASIDAYLGIKTNGKSEKCRNNQRLVIGPWNHFSAPTGEIDFGPQAVLNADEYRMKWYNYWLKGIDNGIMDGPEVNVFLMGENRWIGFDDWPPNNVIDSCLYLREADTACYGSLNNGRLTCFPPKNHEKNDTYLYDPDEPVPSLRTFMDTGPRDYRQIENRVLTYTTDILKNDMTLIGEVKVILFGMSSAEDTDWIVRLCDVWPDGRSMSVCEGALRARYRNSYENEELIIPGKVYKFELDLAPTAQVFKAGHRLRIQVTSSDFPWYDRNLNTGGIFGEEVKGQQAINTVIHNSMYPSHVILPLIK